MLAGCQLQQTPPAPGMPHEGSSLQPQDFCTQIQSAEPVLSVSLNAMVSTHNRSQDILQCPLQSGGELLSGSGLITCSPWKAFRTRRVSDVLHSFDDVKLTCSCPIVQMRVDR